MELLRNKWKWTWQTLYTEVYTPPPKQFQFIAIPVLVMDKEWPLTGSDFIKINHNGSVMHSAVSDIVYQMVTKG
jgi:hypothetical protein